MRSLLKGFIDEYHKDKAAEPDRAALRSEELIEIEDTLSVVLVTVDWLRPSEDEREDLRGLRTSDMADLMSETAEGLRQCPEVARRLDTTPEEFLDTLHQDLSLGGVIESLQLTYRRADTNLLQTCEQGAQALDDVEDQVGAAMSRGSMMDHRGDALESRFTDVMGNRRRMEQHARDKEKDKGPAGLQNEEQHLQEAKGQEELDQVVREFVAAVLGDPPSDRGKGKGTGNKLPKWKGHRPRS